MKLDSIVKSAIRKACQEESVSKADEAVIRLLERYISNELAENQIAGSLQGIYESFKVGS